MIGCSNKSWLCVCQQVDSHSLFLLKMIDVYCHKGCKDHEIFGGGYSLFLSSSLSFIYLPLLFPLAFCPLALSLYLPLAFSLTLRLSLPFSSSSIFLVLLSLSPYLSFTSLPTSPFSVSFPLSLSVLPPPCNAQKQQVLPTTSSP